MKRLVLITLILVTLFIIRFGNTSFAEDKKIDDEKSREVEKYLFMVAGTQDIVLKIGLVDCITYALKNNSEILVEGITPRLKEDDIKIAEADFEPTFSIEASLENAKEHSVSTLGSSSTRTGEFNAGIDGKLMTGTEYGIDFNNKRYKSDSRYQSMNPYYTTDTEITITQPLLRDFGMLVNRADIIIAQNNKTTSMEDFKNKVMDVLTRTKVAYYDYIFYLESYDIARLSLERARDLLEINKERYAKGLVTSVDLLETETAVFQREKALIFAEGSLKKAEDELKLITGLVNDPEIWNAKIELIDKPELTVEKVDLIESLENAFKSRPDYLSEKIGLENRDIKIKVAENALYPTVDLVGSFGLNGLGKDYQESIEKVDKDYKSWDIGLKFSVPWGGGERGQSMTRGIWRRRRP